MSGERPLRVVLLIGSARRGGAEGQLVRLAVELCERGVDVRVAFSAGGGPLVDQLMAAGVPHVLLRPARNPSATLCSVIGMVHMAAYLARVRPDVVFAWLAGVVWCALPLARALTRAKRLAAFRGEVFDRDLRWLARPFRYAVARSHMVTINAPNLEAEARRWGAAPDRIVLIPNGVDVARVQADVRVQPPTAVVVANFRWYKGHDVLLAALELVKSPLSVRLIGEGGSRAEIQQLAQARGIAHKIHLVDDPADVGSELAHAQFAIHPSRTEGLSNAILEQLAAGLPVVATDVGGTSLLIRDGHNGFLVPPGDPEALGRQIETLASSPTLRLAMSHRARRDVSAFQWDACAERYLALLQGLCLDGPASR